MVVGIYARKSIYSDKSDSTKVQIKIGKEYINNNYDNIESVIEYEDEGYTGANTIRPDFERLMNDVKNKKIDVLVCYKIDRISRNVLDFSETFEKLQANGIQFVSVKEQIDTSTPLGRAMMYICSVFAQMERETTAERVKDNMIELAKSGKWAGGRPPLGFKRKRVLINGKNHTVLSKNEDELPFLYMIYDTFLEGFSLQGLETHFRKKGVKSINGNFLSTTQLYNILKNPHYVANAVDVYDYFEKLGCIMADDRKDFDGKHGLVVYGRTSGGKKKVHTNNTPDKWVVSIGLHDPIFSSDKWLSVQEKFGLNKIDKTRKHEIGLLIGIVKCKCGYTMRVQHKVDKIYNKVYDNYFCQNRNRRGIEYCDMKMIAVNLLDDKVVEILKQLSLDKNLIEKYVKQNNDNIQIRDKETIYKEISNLKKKINNLTSAIQDNYDSSAAKYIISEIENIDKQIIGLNYEIREIEEKEKQIKEHIDDVNMLYDKICLFVKNYEIYSYYDKNKYLQEIIKECTWNGEELILSL